MAAHLVPVYEVEEVTLPLPRKVQGEPALLFSNPGSLSRFPELSLFRVTCPLPSTTNVGLKLMLPLITEALIEVMLEAAIDPDMAKAATEDIWVYCSFQHH